MASFDENGKYIKTNWKAGDKITATKLNKIEESIEAVNDNDISRHVEADTRLDALEAKDVAHDKEFTNIKNTIADNKAAAELGDYEINSRMQFLEEELNEGIEEVHNVAETVDGKIAQAEADMEAMVDKVESEMIELQNDITNAQTQTFTVTDAYKFTVDHDGMMPSLVALDNIEGLSSVEINDISKKYLVSTNIGTICTIDINGKNYAEDIVCIEAPHGSECIIDGTNITVRRNTPYTDDITSYAFGSMSIPTLEDGKKYCVFCDNVEISNGGASAIEVQSGNNAFKFGDNLNSLFLDTRTFSDIFVYDSKSFIMRLHCTVGSTVGEVTYKNLQIYEVKEMIVPDIQLNSLPNGVKDEIKDGMLIKRTGYANLGDLEWNGSAYNNTYPNAGYRIYYAYIDDLKLPASNVDENKMILCNMLECKSFNYTKTLEHPEYNIPAISGHPEKGEIRIKLETNDAADLESLRTWLSTNNVSVVYELNSPECIPVNLTIKADKGDTVVINTTKTMDLTYDIQLNTRAQIDALQEISQQMLFCKADINTSINTGITPNLDKQYYILPGGIIMQWGVVLIAANSLTNTYSDIIIDFMIPFAVGATMFQCSLSGGDNGWDGICSGHPISLHHARVVVRNINPAIDNRIYWFAIGY